MLQPRNSNMKGTKMNKSIFIVPALIITMTASSVNSARSADWPAPTAPAISEADGYVEIPHAAVPPRKDRVYKAIFDGTRGAEKPGQLLPVLNMAGSELNALAASGVPSSKVKFAVVMHGEAVTGLLNAERYKERFGVGNPNLPVLAKMKKAGVQIFVCGQQLAADKTDPKNLCKEVTVASDALIVLMTYQNDGYALLSF